MTHKNQSIDKFFTLIKVTERKKGKKIRPIVRRNSDLNFLYNRTIDDVMNCQLKVTKSMLIRNKRPVRLLEIAKIDETTRQICQVLCIALSVCEYF